jgi:type VI secretion system protein ImpC
LEQLLNEIMHAPEFQRLESTWRGLNYLVTHSKTGELLKIKALNVSKDDLYKDHGQAIDFKRSALFKKLYEAEFCQNGGDPFGMLVGDYEFDHDKKDVDLLSMLSNVAAFSQVAFVAAAGPTILNLHQYTDLKASFDVRSVLSGAEFAAWNKFGESNDSVHVGLTFPRVLARLPYGAKGLRVDRSNFEELVNDGDHNHFLWMNGAWAFAARVTDCFAKYGWFDRICGLDDSKVEGLPVHFFPADDGDALIKGSTELAIGDRRAKDLSDLGFIPLSCCRANGCTVLLGARSCQKQRPDVDVWPWGQPNSDLSYLLCAARVLRHLKVVASYKIGSFAEHADFECYLNNWVNYYVLSGPKYASQEQRSRCPLLASRVEIRQILGNPDVFELVVWLRLHTYTNQVVDQRFIAEVPMRI